MEYRLRVATPADEAWQLAIYASTRADELALTGWPASQRAWSVRQQHHAQQQQRGDEEQHESDPHDWVNGCCYSCSLTSQSSASHGFPITENSC